MEQFAVNLVPWSRIAVLVAFVLLAGSALIRAPRSGPSGRWAAAAFGVLALGLFVGWVPDELGVELPPMLDRVQLLLILTFPYLLLRFTGSFDPFPRWLDVAALLAAVAVQLVTILAPLPSGNGARAPTWLGAYIAAVLAYWILLLAVSIVRLWRAGKGQPTVARRRMRLMSAAAAVLAVALLMVGRLEHPEMRLLLNLTALASSMTFALGFSPPRALRLSWRRPEEEELRLGTMAILGAETARDVARELLPPTMRMLGGSGAAIVDPQERVVAGHGQVPKAVANDAAERGRAAVALGDGRGQLVVWTSPYTPFFGKEEIDLLQSMAAVASLALERCELLAEERGRRVLLEQARREADQAREEATRANAAKTEFLARMSHELRTPLNAILGFGQLLETSELSAEDDEAVGYILKGGRHLLELINEVLDLAGIEAGTVTLSLEAVHAGELIHDTLAMVHPLAANRAIRLSAHTDNCNFYVMTDRQRCRQVLLNLLSNAVKYNRDAGKVDVECVSVGDGTVRISVRDTGPGIDSARRAHLFEPFNRLGAETSGVEGTGLGLALSKHLMEHLGGALGVETAPGQGSTFWMDLPITEPPIDATETPSTLTAPADSKERTLLLVEDNLVNLQVVQAMLRRRPGVSILPAMQGQMALDLAYEHRPDLIILDLHLPDLSGREVMHRLRADPRTRHIPIVVASADASPRRVSQLREEGAFDYLTKPLELQHFLQVVDAALMQAGETPARPEGDERQETRA